MDKRIHHFRQSRKTRAKIAELGSIRLCIHRTNSHIYAQIIDATGGNVITSASSLDKGFKERSIQAQMLVQLQWSVSW